MWTPWRVVNLGTRGTALPLTTGDSNNRDQPLTKCSWRKAMHLPPLSQQARSRKNRCVFQGHPKRMYSCVGCFCFGVPALRGERPEKGRARPSCPGRSVGARTGSAGLGPGAPWWCQQATEGCGRNPQPARRARECARQGSARMRTHDPPARERERESGLPPTSGPGCKPRGSVRWRLQAAPARIGGPSDRKCFPYCWRTRSGAFGGYGLWGGGLLGSVLR